MSLGISPCSAFRRGAQGLAPETVAAMTEHMSMIASYSPSLKRTRASRGRGPGAGGRGQADSASCTTAPGLRTGVASARGSLDLAFANLPEGSVGNKDGMHRHAFPRAAWVRIPGRRSGPDRYGRVTATTFNLFQAYPSTAVRR